MLALAAMCLHYRMMVLLSRAGVTVNFFFQMPREQFRMHRLYWNMASRQKLPAWPAYLFWASVAGMFAFGIRASLLSGR